MANERVTFDDDMQTVNAYREVSTDGTWQYVVADKSSFGLSLASLALLETGGAESQSYRVLVSQVPADARDAPSTSEDHWTEVEAGTVEAGSLAQDTVVERARAVALAIRQDSGSGTVEAWLQVAAEGVAGKVGEPLVTGGAHETLTPAAGASSDLQPTSAGVATQGCHITVKNTGAETVWLNFSGADGDGHELKADNRERIPYVSSADGILKVVTDGDADGAGEVHCTYESF